MKNKFYSAEFKKIKIIAITKHEIQKIINAINFIESTDKSRLKRITEIKAILVFPKKDYDNELFPKEKTWVCQSQTIKESSIQYLASLLIHESWHLIQYKRGVKNINNKAEKSAYAKQKEFLLQVDDKKSAQWIDKIYRQNYEIKTALNHTIQSSDTLKKFLNKYKNNELNIIDFVV